MNPVKIIQSIPAQVTLIAVSKTRSIEEIHEMAKLGISTFGENRVQELKQKYDPAYHWHMIGHLQRNKVKDVVPLADMIQSLDSLPLAEEIEKQCAKIDKVMDVLIEVNSSKEASKSGVAPEEALSFLAACMSFPPSASERVNDDRSKHRRSRTDQSLFYKRLSTLSRGAGEMASDRYPFYGNER